MISDAIQTGLWFPLRQYTEGVEATYLATQQNIRIIVEKSLKNEKVPLLKV